MAPSKNVLRVWPSCIACLEGTDGPSRAAWLRASRVQHCWAAPNKRPLRLSS